MARGDGRPAAGLVELHVAGFRSARSASFRPGPVCALVGESGAGKSNLLVAVRLLLEPLAPPPAREDAWGGAAEIAVSGRLAGGKRIRFRGRPGEAPVRSGSGPPAVFLPADLRAGPLIASPFTPAAGDAERLAADLRARAAGSSSSAAPAVGLVEAVESACAASLRGIVLLVEEPELFLRPQTQRYLYRLLRELAANGNQVLYSTHAPAFLNVGRLDELALVEHRGEAGTAIVQPEPLPADATFRALSEFDAERSELFLARAALLVEGRTEKLVFPFLFRALGHDPDREGISIVECGGKPNIPLFARICDAMHVPYLIVHDRDAPAGRKPIQAERAVNAAIAAVAGRGRIVQLAPDFEAVAGLKAHSHKPAHAWRAFATPDPARLPPQLVQTANRVLELARA